MKSELPRLAEDSLDRDFVSLVMSYPAGGRIQACIQCGTCSGSCPVSARLDYTPRRLIEMVRNGMKQEVLSSNNLWYCVSCYTCSSRCPREISLAEIVFVLRCIASAQGQAAPGADFYGRFNRLVRRFGRLYESALIVGSAWDEGPTRVVKLAPLGLRMWRRGRLRLSPVRIRGAEEIEKLCRKVAEMEGAS